MAEPLTSKHLRRSLGKLIQRLSLFLSKNSNAYGFVYSSLFLSYFLHQFIGETVAPRNSIPRVRGQQVNNAEKGPTWTNHKCGHKGNVLHGHLLKSQELGYTRIKKKEKPEGFSINNQQQLTWGPHIPYLIQFINR